MLDIKPARLAGIQGRIGGIAFSPDGTLLAVGCPGEIQLWPVPG